MSTTVAPAVGGNTAPGGIHQEPPWPAHPSHYTLLGKVGQGAFASVWRAQCDAVGAGGDGGVESNELSEGGTGRLCAIKIMDLEHVDTNFVDIRLEVQTMRLSSHPNVLACHTSFIQETNLWLVMQLMDKGSSLNCLLSARIGYNRQRTQKQFFKDSNEEEEWETTNACPKDGIVTEVEESPQWPEVELDLERHITYILHETILGLKYIHDNGQIHRDIKAGNILLDGEGNVRIADFGVSGWLVHGGAQRENTRTFVGTPCWMAPEVMEQVHGYDYKADIWSLGITALELAKGYAPYAKYPPMKVLLLTIQEDPPSFETYQDEDEYEGWSETFRSMIEWCLQKDPKRRPSCEELRNHPHFLPFLDSDIRNQYKSRIKEQICDRIEDVGKRGKKSRVVEGEIEETTDGACMDAAAINEKTQNVRNSSSASKIPVQENRPPGTSWVFPGISDDSTDRRENADFFDEFERTTQGENFVHPSEGKTEESQDDLNAFMDQLQEITSGENFRRT